MLWMDINKKTYGFDCGLFVDYFILILITFIFISDIADWMVKKTESIKGLEDLTKDTVKLARLVFQSRDGHIWAYSDVGLIFSDADAEVAIEEFNRGNRAIFEAGSSDLEFNLAGPSYESLSTCLAKSGGRMVEIDPPVRKIINFYRAHDKALLYTAQDYRAGSNTNN